MLPSWQNKDYEAMYELLSQEGKVKESKEEFIKRYEGYKTKGGQLVEYTLFPLIAGGDRVVIVRVNMRYSKNVLPDIVSGVNRFDMFKEKGDWRIRDASANSASVSLHYAKFPSWGFLNPKVAEV